MRTLKLTLAYDGTNYVGWQRQDNGVSIQQVVEESLAPIAGGDAPTVSAASRTDAGVHALGQVVHVDLPTALPADTLVARINDELPHDINVLSAERVAPRFHARHSAVARRYRYQLSRRRSAFEKPYVWWVREPLDLTRMRAATGHLVGFADFRSFTDDDPEEKSTQVLLQELTLTEEGHLIIVHITGSHFLWKMVRRIVGVLVEVGKGGLKPADVSRLLQQESPLVAKLTAPAAGLFLEEVTY